MNKSILLGRLTKEPEIRFSQVNNKKVANFTLAVNRNYVKQGEERKADFINIVAFGNLADFAEKYLTKGLQICISGRIQIRNWEDEGGQKHYVAEVVAEEIDFADSQKNIENNTAIKNDAQNNEINEKDTIFSDGEDFPF